jgi:hypothetical protein
VEFFCLKISGRVKVNAAVGIRSARRLRRMLSREQTFNDDLGLKRDDTFSDRIAPL